MRKKLFAVLLALTLALSLLPLSAMAAGTEDQTEPSLSETEPAVSDESNDALEPTETEAPETGEEIQASSEETEVDAPTSGTCGDNLTWTLSNGTLTISGTGEMEDFFYYKDQTSVPWSEQGSDITTVVIDPGVTSIGNEAFDGCSNLTSVTIPDSATRIGTNAFGGCPSLTSVMIPDSVTNIGGGAFAGCSGLNGITIPNSVTYIQYAAFAGCDSLTSVVIPTSVEYIGERAFADCENLNEIVVDSSDVLIKYGALSANTDSVIYGYIDSTAQGYADEYQMSFVAINAWSMQNGAPYYEFTVVPESSSTSYVLDSGGSITIYCTGQLENFVQLLIDGQVVDPSNYQLAEGSTIVTLLGAYLDTFSVGKHTVELQYTNGTAQVEITILERGAALPANQNGASGSLDRSPQTGVESRFTLWVTLSMISLAGITSIIVFRRKLWS